MKTPIISLRAPLLKFDIEADKASIVDSTCGGVIFWKIISSGRNVRAKLIGPSTVLPNSNMAKSVIPISLFNRKA